MFKNLFIFFLLISLISCSSDPECPVENITGAYTGTYVEEYAFDEIESEFIESVDVTITDVSGNSAVLSIGALSDDLVFDIDIDGCTFTSKLSVEDVLAFPVEGSFENDKLVIDIISPISIPDTYEDTYSKLEAMAASGDLEGMTGKDLIKAINELDGFDGFEIFNEFVTSESMDEEQAAYALFEFIEIAEDFASQVKIDLSRL